MQLGEWQLDTVFGGKFWLDGGVMYGVVPKAVWQTVSPPDAQNRIPFHVNSVLARNGRNTVLIDTGYGTKVAPLDRSAHGIEVASTLERSLNELGVTLEQIDIVIFSHLHWDHAGGATSLDAQRRLAPTFPNATYFINRWEWEDAVSNAPELSGSYAANDIMPLEQAGQLVLTDGDAEIVPGLRTRVTGGHTRGHQALVFDSGGQVAIYPGDIIPVATHMRRMWCAAYDLYPLDVRRRKPALLGEAADQEWWILWDHDPTMAVSRVERHPKREFVAVDGRERL
jgi:glyoxylase-like metal-dependent hydrolase (beta-lactamase superfamily II)